MTVYHPAYSPDDPELPLPPDRPDCCLGGCAVCVLDGFEDEVAAWKKQVDAILARRAAKSADETDESAGGSS